MKRMKLGDWISIIIIIVSINVMCLWCIDVSVSAMINSPNAIMTNGWSESDPMFTYHIGLYGIIIFNVLTAIICVHFILGEFDDGKNDEL